MISVTYLILFVVIVANLCLVRCEYAMTINQEKEVTKELGRELVEQGKETSVKDFSSNIFTRNFCLIDYLIHPIKLYVLVLFYTT